VNGREQSQPDAPRGEMAGDGRADHDKTAENAAVSVQERNGSFDAATLWGMALGLALMLQPWWDGGLRVGFFVTLGGTVAQIVASHLRPGATR